MSINVSFTDQSIPGPSGPITAWAWDFGDSGTSSSQNPTHTYAAAGTYTVGLTVTGTGGDGTSTASHSVTATTSPSPGGTPPVTVGSLLFFDEFVGAAGTKPDNGRWRAKTATPSNSLANFVGWNQIALDGSSNVVITAAKQSSGRWNTGWLSGLTGYTGKRYIEAKVKVAGGGAGPWNGAIWEWGYPFGARPSIEIDVCEQLGKESSSYHATLHHFPSSSGNIQQGKTISAGVNLSNAYHIYGAAVYADRVDYYLDGVLKATATAAAVGLPDLTVWEEVANVSLNMGGWGGVPVVSSPVSMICDYVHVYRIP